MKMLYLLSLLVFSSGCNEKANSTEKDYSNIDPTEVTTDDGFKRAYFASGCFWCVEEIYESVNGVEEVISGYAGGNADNPTYKNHADHAESVEVIYDPDVVNFKTLVDVYFNSQNIEQENGQGPDIGSSYRSIVFYQNDSQKQVIDRKVTELEQQGYEVAATIQPFEKFYKAEDYHQNYAELHPNNGYIRNVSVPRWRRFAEKMPNVIKEGVSH